MESMKIDYNSYLQDKHKVFVVRCQLMFNDISKIQNLSKRLTAVKNYETCSNMFRPMSVNRRQTLVLDIEDSLVSKVEIQNSYELAQLRKSPDYL